MKKQRTNGIAALSGRIEDHLSPANRINTPFRSLMQAATQARDKMHEHREAMRRGMPMPYDMADRSWEMVERYRHAFTKPGQATHNKTHDDVV
jgi:hypothetical protein